MPLIMPNDEQPLNERVAALEPIVLRLVADGIDLQAFRTTMLTQITELKAELKFLSWRVGAVVGIVVVIGNKLLSYGLDKLLKP